MTGRLILLVDQDEALRRLLAEQLTLHDASEIVEAGSAAAGLAAAGKNSFDAILLNADLPDMDGQELCRRMRRDGVVCPIILMTGADQAPDPNSGASDHVAKPFRLGVLMARLQAQLRLGEAAGDDAVLAIGPYAFHAAAKLLRDPAEGRTIRLTEKEAQILACLHRAEGKTVGREMLLDQVWGYHEGVATHTLETHIYRLRQKIERDPARAELLVTEPGGYRLAV